MQFENQFSVSAPIADVWAILLDVERVAPCLPGAKVLERTGEDQYVVGMRVKIGPISMEYKGNVEIVERTTPPIAPCSAAVARKSAARGPPRPPPK